MPPWYELHSPDDVASPALLVFPERITANLRAMIAVAGGAERLWPHVKTHKMAAVVALHLAEGIRKFKCATLAEAAMVAAAGGSDVLLAYQPVGPNAWRLRELADAWPEVRFATVVDDPGPLAALGQAFRTASRPLAVLLDIDNGMGRTGIAPGPAALDLYRQLTVTPGVAPGGLHVYDGHVREADLGARGEHAERDFRPVTDLVARIRAAGWPLPLIVAGGTPTFPVHARQADRALSPGTSVLWDTSYTGKFPDLEFLPAAVLLARVVSKPAATRLCLDLGYKAVSPNNPTVRVTLLGLEDAVPAVHSEEHLAIDTDRAAAYRIGDVLYGIPYHVCPTCALHRSALAIREGRVVDEWLITARDRDVAIRRSAR